MQRANDSLFARGRRCQWDLPISQFVGNRNGDDLVVEFIDRVRFLLGKLALTARGALASAVPNLLSALPDTSETL